MQMRTWTLFNIALLGFYFGACALFYTTLPERIPVHFGVSGNADTWAQTSFISWFGLPLLALLTVVILNGSARLGRNNPHVWNVPRKKDFVKLPPERRMPVVHEAEIFLARVGAMTVVLFATIQLLIYHTAQGSAGYSRWLFYGVLAAWLIWLPIDVIRLNRRIERMIDDAAATPVQTAVLG